MKPFLRSKIGNVLAGSLLLLGGAGAFQSCHLNDEGPLYTFVGETVASYLEKYPELYGEFCEVLDTTGIIDLLATYGTYTVFAPVNEAMKAYYADSGAVNMKEFLDADTSRFTTLRNMVYFQIIPDKVYETSIFPESKFDDKNMMERYITVSFKTLATTGNITVNGSSEIIYKDQEVHNGIVHAVNRVLVPSNKLLPEYISSDPRFSLFSEALYATKLSEKLIGDKDDSYKVPKSPKSGYSYPKERLYQYTAFVEPDSIYRLHGINSLQDLTNHAKEVYDPVYPQYASIDDITDPNNSLNRFVAYHLLNYRVYEGEFLYRTGMFDNTDGVERGAGLYDYLIPMAPHSLIEVKEKSYNNIILNKKKDGSYINVVGKVRIGDSDQADNGLFHEIDDLLEMDLTVLNEVFTKRLRIDVFATLPEMMNVGMRPIAMGRASDVASQWPTGYFETFTYDDESQVCSPRMNGGSVQHQGAMFYIYGNYDVTHKIPSVPDGNWEFRLGIKTRASSILQIYVDGMPNGIPLDMTKNADHPEVGFIYDKDYADELGMGNTSGTNEASAEQYRLTVLNGKPNENDKDLRNRGWMKAPDSFHSVNGFKSARDDNNSLRRILGRYEFDLDSDHFLRVKAVGRGDSKDGEPYFGYDYIEFIPLSMIDDEDIY